MDFTAGATREREGGKEGVLEWVTGEGNGERPKRKVKTSLSLRLNTIKSREMWSVCSHVACMTIWRDVYTITSSCVVVLCVADSSPPTLQVTAGCRYRGGHYLLAQLCLPCMHILYKNNCLSFFFFYFFVLQYIGQLCIFLLFIFFSIPKLL